MNETEYIEAYFTQQLTETEKRQFEERCVQDTLFAGEVAFYITVSEAARRKLLERKQQEWSDHAKGAAVKSSGIPILRKILPYLAAAVVLVAVALYILVGAESPHTLAHDYVTAHFTRLNQTMNAGGNNALQQGVAAYNNKEYTRALQLFSNAELSPAERITATRYAGIVYLAMKDYEMALRRFDELANLKGLYRNPGLFLKAVTLLERNHAGDKAAAKQLLEQVVQGKMEGASEAESWLEKW